LTKLTKHTEWWHNAGIIAFACLSTWFITKLGGGLVMVCIIGSICATYYRTSIRRVRRNARDDITRELAKTRLDSDLETLEWLNSFVVKFWPIYEPNLSAGIINTADGILANAAPGFLDSIRLPTFTLGTKPPRIDHVKTYPKTEDDIVEMDWSFSFTPNDTADLTSRQLKNKLNPKVVLEARVGKGIASKGIPIIVEDMAFSGTMKVKIKLQINFPHVEKVDVCFLGRPVFDYVLKPLGGDTFGFDIGFLPGLSGFIQEMIHGTLQPMFYSPNVFTLEVAKILGGAPIDTAIGVLVVTVHRAHGLSGSPDPYTVLSINQRAELARTKTIEGSSDPKWSETKYIVVSNLNDNLTLTVFDYNDIRKDKELGVVNFPLSVLQETPEHENQTLPIMFNGKPRGQMVFDIRFFPVLEGPVLADGKKGPPPESNTGILRYTVSQAKDLDASKSLIGHLTPYCQMTLNNRHVHTTKVIKRNNNPIWEESHEIFITNQKACKLGVIIKDERGFIDDPIIGKYQIKLPDLLDGNGKGTEWFNLTGVKSGRVKMTAQWKPVTVKGIAGTGGYVTPVGVVRLHFQNAKDLRNLEAVSKSDPYVRILLNGVQKSRTITVENNLNPEWDEVHYIPVHSEKEKLTLEVMDQETLGKDRSLGAYQLDLAELLQVDSQGLYQVHDEKKNRSAGLISDRKGTVRGTLNFTASFYPCLNVADPEDEEEKKLKELETEKGVQNVKPRALGEGMAAEDDNMKELEILRSPISPAFTISSEADVSEKGPPKIKLTPEDLVKYGTLHPFVVYLIYILIFLVADRVWPYHLQDY
jgi:Ca2+-dependent lipid-binding protein